MLLSRKSLIIPVLGLSLIAGSAFAGNSELLQNANPGITVIQPTAPAAQWVPPVRNRWQRLADWVEVKSCGFNPCVSLALGVAVGVDAACKSNNSLTEKLATGALHGLAMTAITYLDLELLTMLICIGAETD